MLGPSRASGKHMGTDQTGTPIRRAACIIDKTFPHRK